MNTEIIKDYLEFIKVEKGLSPTTQESYYYELIEFDKYINKTFRTCTTGDILEYLNVIGKTVDNATLAHKFTVIKNIFKYLIDLGMIDKDIIKDIKRPKLMKKIPNVLTIEEVNKLLDITINSNKDIRNKAMLELMYASGLRISELLELKLQDIDFNNCVVRCFGKGSKERIIPMGEKCIKYLNDYIRIRHEFLNNKISDYLFLSNRGGVVNRTTFFKIVKNLMLEKDIKKNISPHTLRHSFATHLLEGGANIRAIQFMMGHADLSTTKHYTKISNNRLKKEYINNHPREHKIDN